MEYEGLPMQFVYGRTLIAVESIRDGLCADNMRTDGVAFTIGADENGIEILPIMANAMKDLVPFICSCLDDQGLKYEQQPNGGFLISACTGWNRRLH